MNIKLDDEMDGIIRTLDSLQINKRDNVINLVKSFFYWLYSKSQAKNITKPVGQTAGVTQIVAILGKEAVVEASTKIIPELV